MATKRKDEMQAAREATRHETELDALEQIAKVLTTRAGQRQMLHRVLEVLHGRLGMSRGTVMLVSTDGTDLVVEAAHQLDQTDHAGVRYRRGEGIVGRVLTTGEPAVVPCIAEEPAFKDRIHRRRDRGDEGISFVCVPIVLGRDVVGTLSVDVPREGAPPLDEARRVLRIVAGMIAGDVGSRRRARTDRRRLEDENRRLREDSAPDGRPDVLVGNSRAICAAFGQVRHVADSDTPVLTRGECGTGKDAVAATVHRLSHRSEAPLVRVSCSAPSNLVLESEIFGHEPGAFRTALQARKGLVEQAVGGTLYLDEVGNLSPAVQVKLLRLLQEREFERLGSSLTRHANVRIIASSEKDLDLMVAERRFRQDLYFCLAGFPIYLPPLRERKDDILPLADAFVSKHARRLERHVRRISSTAIDMLLSYHWPGNVRELESAIEHGVRLAADGVLHGRHLPPTLQKPGPEDAPEPGSLSAQVEMLERDMLMDSLKRENANMSAAARELGITPRMVRYKVKKLGIDLEAYRNPAEAEEETGEERKE